MSNRPVFVPRSKRRSKKPYFRGAFTGGFSAGYYNTVGSKEGWTPRDHAQEKAIDNGENDEGSRKPNRPQQRMEDFMDEQDHNEWGGPTSVKKEYDQSKPPATKSLSAFERVVMEPPPNVGRKLMRALGWRDGSTAYVPLDRSDTAALASSEAAKDEESLLTAKRLKKIRLQQTRVRIPPPKLDVCGLGFSRYQDAPEFERHLKKRKRLAEERARAATGSGGGRNVYRMSHLLEKQDEDVNDDIIENPRGGIDKDFDDHNVSYETIQDFIGSKSVGGFALREDDDDVYDDNPVAKKAVSSLKVDDDEYDTVVYEHNSDEEGEKKDKDGKDFGGVLASWASLQGPAGPTPHISASRGVTSDGRPPLAGFVLGGSGVTKVGDSASNENKSQTVRFAGPDVPFGVTIKRHEFGQDEHPDVFGEMSRSAQQELMLASRHTAAVESLRAKAPNAARPQTLREKSRSQVPMAGGAFSGLAVAMKNRFTAGDKSASNQESAPAHPIGLHQPQPNASRDGSLTKEGSSEETTLSAPKEESITITRTISSFIPNSLLCKRFHVHVPRSVVAVSSTKEQTVDPKRKGEAAYFQNEILKPASVERAKRASETTESKLDVGSDVKDEPPLSPIERPPMQVLKSIFEPDSGSSESDDDSGSEDEDRHYESSKVAKEGSRNITENSNPVDSSFKNVPTASRQKQPETEFKDTSEESRPAEPSGTDKTSEKQRKKRRHREDSSVHSREESEGEHRRNRMKRRNKADGYSSSDGSDSYRRRKKKKERRRRDEKKKRKKHKSSKRRYLP